MAGHGPYLASLPGRAGRCLVQGSHLAAAVVRGAEVLRYCDRRRRIRERIPLCHLTGPAGKPGTGTTSSVPSGNDLIDLRSRSIWAVQRRV